MVQGGDITTPPALIEDEVTAPLDLSRSGPLDLSIQSTQEGHIGLAVQASNSPILTSAASTKPEVLVEQVEPVEIIIQADKIIILSPEEDVCDMIAVPVDGSVLIEQIGPVAVVPESEPPHLDSFATQGGSMDLAQTDHPLVASPGVLVDPSVAAGQDELPPLKRSCNPGWICRI